MKVITFNINGLRSALKKGLDDFILEHNPDVLLLQETRISQKDLDKLNPFSQYPYKHYNHSNKAGYSGTAIISKSPLKEVYTQDDSLPLCEEGRYIFATIQPGLKIVNFYLPSGTSSELRQSLKLDVLKGVKEHLSSITQPLLVSGDMNLTRNDIDLKNFKGNKNKPGCTIQERQLFEDILQQAELTDCHRHLEPKNEDIYTWWTYRAGAFAKNVGWRIDYHLLSQSLQTKIKNCQVISSPRISDHGALELTLDI